MHMKLEGWDDLNEEETFFCWACGKQLHSVDEIAQRICHECKPAMIEMTDEGAFFCWACGKKLLEMSEVAQGVCHNCKAGIIRRLRATPK